MRESQRASEFSEFVAARWAHLVRTAVLLGCDQAGAEDLAQTTLAHCLRAWPRVRRAEDRDAYVHRILVNALRDGLRRRSSRELVTDLPLETSSTAPDAIGALDDRLSLAAALGRLGPDQRAVVVLRFYVDLSEIRTAEVLGIAPGTVKSRLHRALRVLGEDPAVAALVGRASTGVPDPAAEERTELP